MIWISWSLVLNCSIYAPRTRTFLVLNLPPTFESHCHIMACPTSSDAQVHRHSDHNIKTLHFKEKGWWNAATERDWTSYGGTLTRSITGNSINQLTYTITLQTVILVRPTRRLLRESRSNLELVRIPRIVAFSANLCALETEKEIDELIDYTLMKRVLRHQNPFSEQTSNTGHQKVHVAIRDAFLLLSASQFSR